MIRVRYQQRHKYFIIKLGRDYKLSSAYGFVALLTLLVYGILLVLVIEVIYVLFLAIKALQIYIHKNS